MCLFIFELGTVKYAQHNLRSFNSVFEINVDIDYVAENETVARIHHISRNRIFSQVNIMPCLAEPTLLRKILLTSDPINST